MAIPRDKKIVVGGLAFLLGVGLMIELKKKGLLGALQNPWARAAAAPPSAPSSTPSAPRYAPAAPAAAPVPADQQASEEDRPVNQAYTASYGDAPAGGGYYEAPPGG